MKTKYLIVTALAIAVLVPFVAHAQDADIGTSTATSDIAIGPTEDVTITPDSPFYFLKRVFEDVGTFFTFGSEAKARRFQELANRRIAEAKKLAEKGSEKAEVAVNLYEKFIERAKEKAQETNKEDLIERITEATNNHIEVLQEVMNKVPDQAKDVIAERIEKAKQRQQELIEKIKNIDPEKAGELASDALASRVNMLKRFAKHYTPEQMEKMQEAVEHWKDYLEKIEETHPELSERIADRIDKVMEHIQKIQEDPEAQVIPEKVRNRLLQMKDEMLEKHIRAIRNLESKDPEKAAELIEKLSERREAIRGDKEEILHLRDEVLNRLEENESISPEVKTRILERIREHKIENEGEGEGFFKTPPSIGPLPPEISSTTGTTSNILPLSPLKRFEKRIEERKERVREHILDEME